MRRKVTFLTAIAFALVASAAHAQSADSPRAGSADLRLHRTDSTLAACLWALDRTTTGDFRCAIFSFDQADEIFDDANVNVFSLSNRRRSLPMMETTAPAPLSFAQEMLHHPTWFNFDVQPAHLAAKDPLSASISPASDHDTARQSPSNPDATDANGHATPAPHRSVLTTVPAALYD